MIEVLKSWYKNLLSDPNSATLFLLMAFIVCVIYYFAHALMPLLLALGVSFILEVPIRYLENKKILRRWISTSLLMCIFFSFLIFVSITVLPNIIGQLGELLKKIPAMLTNLNTFIQGKVDEYPSISQYIDLASVSEQLQSKVAQVSGDFIQNKLISFLMNLTSFLVYLIIVPLLSFFMLKDKQVILGSLKRLFPANLKLATKVWNKMNEQLMNYVSGKFIHVLIISGVNFIAFKLFNLNYSLLLGLAVGFSVVIPYVGAFIVTIPIVAIALFQFGLSGTFGGLLITYIIIQILDGNVLTPLLFSEKMKLHPFVILASVLFFGAVWGFWGVFFAIPLATLIKTIIDLWPHGAYVDEQPKVIEQALVTEKTEPAEK